MNRSPVEQGPDDSGRGAHDDGGLADEHRLECRARYPIDGVLEQPWNAVVVLGCRDDQAAGGGVSAYHLKPSVPAFGKRVRDALPIFEDRSKHRYVLMSLHRALGAGPELSAIVPGFQGLRGRSKKKTQFG